VLYTAHGFHFTSQSPWWQRKLFYNLERVLVRLTSGLIVINSEDHESAINMGYIPRVNLHLVQGVGVDIPEPTLAGNPSTLRICLGISPEAVVVTYVAYLRPDKNHAFLLRIWGSILKRYPASHLLLVGDGPLRNNLKHLCQREAIKNVTFCGNRSDVGDILRETDIVVSTSLREGLPRSLMEAMAAGKPVVATDIRGNRDLIRHGRNGHLVRVGDTADFAEKVCSLIENPGLRAALGEQGRKDVEAFGLPNVRAEIRSVYSAFLPPEQRTCLPKRRQHL
jgi:glycosyltransferase involved in cell wall biosynthesis